MGKWEGPHGGGELSLQKGQQLNCEDNTVVWSDRLG